MGQQFRSSSCGGFRLRSSLRLQSGCPLGLRSSERLDEVENLLRSHLHSWQVDADCWCECVKVAQLCLMLLWLSWTIHGLYSPWNSPGQNTGVRSLSLLQGIFPYRGSNPGLPHWRQILYQLSHQGNPRTLEWVAYPFSSGSSRPRNRTGVSCITGGFFTSWAIREALCLLHIVSAKQFPFYLFRYVCVSNYFFISNL